MSVSDDIRSLARDGLSTTEIARRLGMRYQHAYNVLKTGGMPAASRLGSTAAVDTPSRSPITPKPPLSVHELVEGGFELSGRWILSESGDLAIDRPIPNGVGVYAFAKEEIAVYIGVSTMGLAKRMYFYRNPGVAQPTNQRINGTLRSELLTVPFIEILTATPPDLEWNGLPVHGRLESRQVCKLRGSRRGLEPRPQATAASRPPAPGVAPPPAPAAPWTRR